MTKQSIIAKESKFVNEEYLSKTQNPSFNNFATKFTPKITVYSTDYGCENAFDLMCKWIKFYNTAVRLYRKPNVLLQKHLNSTTNTFKNIYKMTTALSSAKNDLMFDGIKTSSQYALRSGRMLRDTGNSDTIEQADIEEEEDNANQDISEVRHELEASLAHKLSHGNFIEVKYRAKNNQDVEQLFAAASMITQDKNASKDDVDFMKLIISSCMNMLTNSDRERLSKLIPQAFSQIKQECFNKKDQFKNTLIPVDIDQLFDELKQYRFDTNTDKIITWIDTQKSLETNKRGDRYLLLNIIKRSVDNFKKLNKKKVSESTYSSVFKDIIEVILDDTQIEVDDGENVSNATKRMCIMNDYDENEFGRRIDVLLHQSQYDHEVEYCGIEFKTQDACDATLKYQQSKNIRINATMLNDLITTTKNSKINNIYMDWWGATGYMVQIFKYRNFFLAHHISSLCIPKSLVELDEFRTSLKCLYKWRHHLIELSREIALEILKDKRKFDTIDISSPTTPTISPNRSPSLLPVDVFFTPQNKRVKKVL